MDPMGGGYTSLFQRAGKAHGVDDAVQSTPASFLDPALHRMHEYNSGPNRDAGIGHGCDALSLFLLSHSSARARQRLPCNAEYKGDHPNLQTQGYEHAIL